MSNDLLYNDACAKTSTPKRNTWPVDPKPTLIHQTCDSFRSGFVAKCPEMHQNSMIAVFYSKKRDLDLKLSKSMQIHANPRKIIEITRGPGILRKRKWNHP